MHNLILSFLGEHFFPHFWIQNLDVMPEFRFYVRKMVSIYVTLGSRFGFCVVSERMQASHCVADRPLAVLTVLADPDPVTRSGKNKHGGRYLSHTHYKLLNLSALEVFFS